MNRLIATGAALAATAIAAAPLTAWQDVALKDLMPKGMVIGVAINQRQSDGVDSAAVDLITKQFNQISPENLLKFQSVHPAADRYVFEAQDRYVQFGLDRKMQVSATISCGIRRRRPWVFQGADGKPADRETLLARMRDHIHTVVGRYKGKIHGWDVVNEAIDEDGTLRKAPWRDGIGDDYVAKAFEFAHEADPDAELYYNDYNLREAGQARGCDPSRQGFAGARAAHRRHRQPGTLAPGHAGDRRDRGSTRRSAQHRAQGDVTELDINLLPQAGPRRRIPRWRTHTPPVSPTTSSGSSPRRYADIFGVFRQASRRCDPRDVLGSERCRLVAQSRHG